jgi:CHAT domain-containing protein
MLMACRSAQSSTRDAFIGLGPQLVKIGLPAVVAMQDDISVPSARRFGERFYRRLLEHGVVDLAMNEARSALITDKRYDAAVPVLFMRLRHGRLWGEAQPIEIAAPSRGPT